MSIEKTTQFIAQSIEGSAERGGWQAAGFFANAQAQADYSRAVDVRWLAEGGAVWEPAYKLGITGYIVPQSVRFNYRQSETPVTVSTSDAFITNFGLQGIYFVDDATPVNPHQITDMNLGKIVQHIIEQHCDVSSTAFVQNDDGTYSANLVGGRVDTTDIDTTNSTSVDVYTVRQSDSMWRTLGDIAANEFYIRYMSKDDKFHYVTRPQFAASLPAVTLELDNTNIVGQPEVMFRNEVKFDQVALLALTDDGEILRAEYPANISSQGRRKKYTNLRCNSQSRLDTLAQRVWQYENREYQLRLQIPNAWGLLLELFDRVSVTYSGTARNGVSLNLVDEKFYVNTIRVNRSGNFGAISELVLEQENLEEGSASVG